MPIALITTCTAGIYRLQSSLDIVSIGMFLPAETITF